MNGTLQHLLWVLPEPTRQEAYAVKAEKARVEVLMQEVQSLRTEAQRLKERVSMRQKENEK